MTILKETKRILSLVLAICLLAGVLPSLAIADSTWKNRETPYGAKLKAGTVLYADEEMEQEAWLLKEDTLVRVTEARHKTAKVEFTVKKQPKTAWVDGELLQPVDLATPTDLDALVRDEDVKAEEIIPQVVISSEIEESPSESVSTEPEPEEINPQDVILSEVEESNDEQVPTDNQPEEPENPEDSENPELPDVVPETEEPEEEKEPADESETIPEETDTPAGVPEEEPSENDENKPGEEELEEEPPVAELTEAEPEEEIPVVEETVAADVVEEEDVTGSIQEDLIETETYQMATASVPEQYEAAEEETADDAVYVMNDKGAIEAKSYSTPKLPAIRDQNPYGSCWAFAAVGGLEMDLIKDGNATKTIDLSEFFLVYYAGHTYPNPKKTQDEVFSDTKSLFDGGGNRDLSTYILSVLIGTTTEKDNPYTPTSGIPTRAPQNIRNIAAQIAGAYFLDMNDRDLVKQMIIDHGAVSASVQADNNKIKKVGNYWTLYNTDKKTDHAILLVGWDDNFPTSRFSTTPPGKGAWKVRNSWGSSWGSSGYFWVSYYDAGLLSGGGVAYDAQNGKSTIDDFCYSYATTYASSQISGGKEKAVVVQKYAIDAKEQIRAIGVDVLTAGVKVAARVLVGGKEVGRTATITAKQDGFYRLPLKKPYLMSSRGTVEVQVTYTGNKKDTIWIRCQQEELYDKQNRATILPHKDSNGFTVNGRQIDADSTIRVYTKQQSSAGLVKTVKLNKTSHTMYSGDVLNLKATITPSNATNKKLSWTTSNSDIAFLDGDGKVVGGTKAGTAQITAMSSNGIYAVCNVTVKKKTVALKSLSISSKLFKAGTKAYKIKATQKYEEGDTLTLTAEETPVGTTQRNYQWKSSNTDVISIGNTFRNECEIKFRGNGKARITVTSKDNKKIKAYVDITVKLYVPVRSMYYTPSLTLNEGDTYQLTVELIPSDATNQKVTWKSDNKAVATVTSAGKVKGIKKGTAKITMSAEGGKVTATCNVTVRPRASSVSLSSKAQTVYEGDSFILTATVSPSDAVDKRITWSSSNTDIARVNSSGRVTGVKDGKAVITVTTVDGGKTATCNVTVQTKDLVKAFVYRMYRVCLLREPDEGGFNSWVAALKGGSATGAQLAYGFLNSSEMINRKLSDADFIERNYEAIMGRKSDAGGKQGWKDALAAGMSRKAVISGFVKSAEFAQLCAKYGIRKGDYTSDEARDVNMGVTGFVSRLYTKMLGRAYDPSGLNAWSAAILKAPTAATVLQVSLNGFMHSPEFVNKNLNDTELVKVLYRTFLDREADEGGLSAWVQALQQGNDRDTVAAGFANSPEFAAIMAKYGF